MNKRIEEEIEIDGRGYKYIGEFLDDLPENAMLNKVTTGSGMTTVVLKNDVKYVLAVPFKSLIINKESWCKDKGIDVCSVYYGGCEEDELLNFKGNKIITTYDSLAVVTEALAKRGDISKWKVCIDEAHKLVDSAAFRPNAIRSVLDNYNKYKSYVFGTATPVNDKYQLPVLKGIKKYRIEWGELEAVTVNFCHYDNNINDVAAIIGLDFINETRDGNAHIFINSVNSICSIINKMKKVQKNISDNVRIVCADNNRNYNLIKSKLSNEFQLSVVDSEVKKLNFYTSTAFEGCDIFDEEGKNFIITDGKRDYTKIDIATLLPQIIGRVRNSRYSKVVDLIYTRNSYFSNTTEEEFEAEVLRNIEEARSDIEEFNNFRINSIHRKNALEHNSAFLLVDNDKLVLNDSAWYNEMHNFSTLRKTYFVSKNDKNNGIVEGKSCFNNIDYNYKGIEKIELKGINKLKLGNESQFRDLCLDYIEAEKNQNVFYLHIIREKDSIISEAFRVLGEDKMRALKFRKKLIKEALLIDSTLQTNDFKIVNLLRLKVGAWISKAEAKEKLQKIYGRLRLTITAKSSDLEKWFTLKNQNRRIDGKLINGLAVVTCNFKIN